MLPFTALDIMNTSFLQSKKWQLDPASMYPELHRKRVIDVGGVKYLSRYEDVATLLHHPDISNMLGSLEGTPLRESMLQQDPPAHGRIRSTTGAALNKQPIQKLRSDIDTFAEALFVGLRPKGEVEFVSEVAQQLPLFSLRSLFSLTVAEIEQLSVQVKNFVARGSSNLPEGQIHEAQFRDLSAIRTFFREAIRRREQNSSPDLLMALIDSARQGELSEPELLDMCLILTIGGVETTSTAMSSVLLLLHQQPALRTAVQSDVSLLPSIIEETLRLESPIKLTSQRRSTADVKINDLSFPAGTAFVGLIGVANRDPDVFDQPDALDIMRKGKPHLGFGYGVHYCVGSHFARLQIQVALERMFTECPSWRLTPRPRWRRLLGQTDCDWSPNPLVRGLEKLHVVWDV